MPPRCWLTHPRLRRAIGKARPARAQNAGLDGHPLVVQQFVGSGRSLFFGIDETWRWRWRENEQHFNTFWMQTMRYLARSRTGTHRAAPGQADAVPPRRADPRDGALPRRRPAAAAGNRGEGGGGAAGRPDRCGPGDVDVQTLTLTKVEGSRSNFEALLTRTPEGDYHFWLNSPAVQGPRPKAECKVLAPPGEMEVLRMNQIGDGTRRRGDARPILHAGHTPTRC